METTRALDVRSGIQIEIFTIAWMVVEMAVSLAAGIAAGSILLIAFGFDSLIELVSGCILLWRLRVESQGGDLDQVESAERKAARMVVVLLAILCVYVLVSAIYGLVSHAKPESSPPGLSSPQRPCSSCPTWRPPSAASRKRSTVMPWQMTRSARSPAPICRARFCSAWPLMPCSDGGGWKM
jgi:hypothetical protein